MKRRFKIYAGVGAITSIGCLVLCIGMIHADHTQRVSAALRSARLMIAEAEAAARYTHDEVGPLLNDTGAGRMVFIPQSTGFYAVEKEGQLIGRSLPGYRLRRVVLDPTGPSDTPDPWEHDAIERLRGAKNTTGLTELHTNGTLSYIAPLTMHEGACATCYSSRQAAPVTVRDTFGHANGFNRHPGEIIGATIATVPVPGATRFFQSFLSLICVLAVIVVAGLCGALEYFIMRPLDRMTTIAESLSMGEENVAQFDTARPDEIGALARSFNRLRRSMESAIALVQP